MLRAGLEPVLMVPVVEDDLGVHLGLVDLGSTGGVDGQELLGVTTRATIAVVSA